MLEQKQVRGVPSLLIALVLTAAVRLLLAPASWAQDCVPANSPPAVHAGNILTLTVFLSSDDPNENGEGESMTVRSSGGYVSAPITNFNSTQILTFVASVDGETVGGYIDGDGDESCTLSLAVDKHQRLLAGILLNLDRLKLGFEGSGATFGSVAAACFFAPEPAFSKACALIGALGAALSGDLFFVTDVLETDPPDPNYKVIATPTVPALQLLGVQSGVTPGVAAAFNAWMQNEESMIGYSAVLLTCFNRAQGAAAAGDAFWEAQQAAAAQQYERQLGGFQLAEPALRASLQAALQAEGFPVIPIASADIQAYQQSVAANGLPSDVVAALQGLGATAAQIDQIAQATVVADSNAAAQSFPAVLTDPNLIAALQATGQGLQAGCVADPTTICVNGNRFAVGAAFSASGTAGLAQAVQLTPDTGYLWFFDPSNVEAIVKVIDGCGLGGHFWFFAGGLTNVNTTITVMDTRTGAITSYTNPADTPFQPIQDTSAFATCTAAGGSPPVTAGAAPPAAAASASLAAPASAFAPPAAPSSGPPAAAPSVPATPDSLLLGNGRFRIDVSWHTADGMSGAGTPAALTADTGTFWFFNSSNIELVVKVLDGCGLNSDYWVFAGGLTDVQTAITVTDTRTGQAKRYTNHQGTAFQPIQDTAAFATCP